MGRVRIRGHAVIAIAVALSAFVFPDVAQGHGRWTVVALDMSWGILVTAASAALGLAIAEAIAAKV